MNRRVDELDALRGLCALGVMSYHFVLRAPNMYLPGSENFDRFQWGYYRIQMFCLLSGYVISMVLERPGKPRNFLRARFSRLYPAYALAVLLTSCVVQVCGVPDRSVSLPQVLGNLTMLQTWLGVRSVDSAYWFLAPELSFYALMLAIARTGQLRHVERLGMLGLLAMGVNESLYSPVHVSIPHWLEVSRLPSLWHIFFAGILFQRIRAHGSNWQRHALLALCFAVQCLLSDDARLISSLAMCFGVFYLLLLERLGWIVNRVTLFFGGISYSLFLLHENLGFTIIWYLGPWASSSWLRWLVPALVVTAAATVMTYAWERPMMAFIRGRGKDSPR